MEIDQIDKRLFELRGLARNSLPVYWKPEIWGAIGLLLISIGMLAYFAEFSKLTGKVSWITGIFLIVASIIYQVVDTTAH